MNCFGGVVTTCVVYVCCRIVCVEMEIHACCVLEIDVYFVKNYMSVSAEIVEGFCMPKLTILGYEGVKCGTNVYEHMNSWNECSDRCSSKMQVYWFMTIDVVGGTVGIGSSSRQAQPTSGTGRWLSTSFFIHWIRKYFNMNITLLC